MNRNVAIASFFLMALLTGLAPASAQISTPRRIAMYSLPAVARIFDGYVGAYEWRGKTYKCGGIASGSGFFIHSTGYLVTNAHVVEMTQKGEEWGKNEFLFQDFLRQVVNTELKSKGVTLEQILENKEVLSRFKEEAKLVNFQPIRIVRMADGQERPFEIKKFGDIETKDVAVIKIETRNAPTLSLGDSDAMQVVDYVMVIGYPAAGLSPSMDDRSQLVASVTDGRLSAKKNLSTGVPVFQVSAPATPGNSGGPVLNDAAEVIGLASFLVPVNGQLLTGFTFVYTSNTVKEFVREMNLPPDSSLTNRYYREGLELMWQGQYALARDRFSEVRLLYPSHPEVDTLILQCSEGMRGRPLNPNNPNLLIRSNTRPGGSPTPSGEKPVPAKSKTKKKSRR